MVKNVIYYLLLFVACSLGAILVLPAINSNIDDPNMIVYFNPDQGGQMDLAWYYYTGTKRDSFQWDNDYGLEFLYIADLARFALSRFVVVKPGTFVLIGRWLNLIAWMLALIALWRLVKYHFGAKWQALLAVILLAVRPVFMYLSACLKPDTLVLLLVIVGLDHALRIIEDPFARKNLIIAVACAAAALVIKYAGIFLLPVIIVSMLFAERRQGDLNSKRRAFPEIRSSWAIYLFVGIAVLAATAGATIFYVRKSTSLSWYAQFGLWGSITHNAQILCIYVGGLLLALFSIAIFFLNKFNGPICTKIMKRVNAFNSKMALVISLFVIFIALFGFRWIIKPADFFRIYSQFIPQVFGANPALTYQIRLFDPAILFLVLVYMVLELAHINRNIKADPLKLYKRLILSVFLLCGFAVIFSPLNISQHHMLPFFAIACVLSLQGIHMLILEFCNKRVIKNICLFFAILLVVFDILINGAQTWRLHLRQTRQKEDMAFEARRWWRENIPPDAKIAADHYLRVYIPEGYANIRTLKWNQTLDEMKKLVREHRPQFVYYNGNPFEDKRTKTIEELLPGVKTRLVKCFEPAKGQYNRFAKDRFLLYEIF